MGEVVKNADLNKIDLDDAKYEAIIAAFNRVTDLLVKFVAEHREELLKICADGIIKKGSNNERL